MRENKIVQKLTLFCKKTASNSYGGKLSDVMMQVINKIQAASEGEAKRYKYRLLIQYFARVASFLYQYNYA
ncbi:hypothetical protein D3H65_09550 [Paraflavitalea soli]|uniref:Uncharacterized protein n=1 Tax=Paraflavitalea soli TaxID=2315862 RepID=A0A3B7MIG6_9BACT|nr:hypothetical protein D3H65_09550 [Paraflavitalea soli]